MRIDNENRFPVLFCFTSRSTADAIGLIAAVHSVRPAAIAKRGLIRPFDGIGLIYVNCLRRRGPIVGGIMISRPGVRIGSGLEIGVESKSLALVQYAALPLMIAIVAALAVALLMRETYPKPRSL